MKTVDVSTTVSMLASVLGKPSAKKFGGGGTVKFSIFEMSRTNWIPCLKEVG